MKKFEHPGLLYTDVIANNAKTYGDKPAVVCGDQRLSWAEFHRRTNKVANALLKLGLKKGDKVCLLMQNSVQTFELMWGTIKAGGVTVPLNVMLAQDSLGLMINNSEAKWLFADPATVHQVDKIRKDLQNIADGCLHATGSVGGAWQSTEKLVEAAPDTDPEVKIDMSDSMNIIYSSGTTGVPKGIEHSHFARLIYPLGVGPGLDMDRFSVALCSTPLYTNGTWITMLPAVYLGGTVVLLSKFSAHNFLDAVQREKATHAFMVPTQFIVLLEAPNLADYDTRSLRVLLSGGQALPTKTAEGIEKNFPTAGLYEMYGMTEGFMTIASPDDIRLLGKRGTVGMSLFGGDICIIDGEGKELPPGRVGEVAGWSAAIMKGYYRDEKRTDEIVWHGPRGRTYIKSGDVGKLDERGYLYISGRVKDMIKSGGINVYAADIEEVFMRHPDVVEATAVGIPHDKWGETPLLLVIMREGSAVSEDALMQWGNEKLGKYQRVSRVEYRKEFPRVTHDKVNKRALRDPYWEGRERKI